MRSRPGFDEAETSTGASRVAAGILKRRGEVSAPRLDRHDQVEPVPLGSALAHRTSRGSRSTPAAAGSGLDSRQELLDVPGLAAYLAVSEKFVRKLVDQRRIPFLKVGKLVRFDPTDVTQWLSSCSVEAVR